MSRDSDRAKTGGGSRRRAAGKGAGCGFALVLLAAIFFGRILFRAEAVLPSPMPDMLDRDYPARTWAFRELSRGTLPRWNPHVFGGMPFRTETAVYYPLNAIFFFIPAARALAILTAGHLALAGLFFYLFVRSLGVGRAGAFASAAAYMFGAQQVLRVFSGHLSITMAAAWIPLLFFFVERYLRNGRPRDAVLGAAALALQIFADNTQIVFYTCLSLLVFAFLRSLALLRETGEAKKTAKRCGGAAGIIALGIGLAALQLIPEAELAVHSTRADVSYEFASSFSFPPENLVTFLFPTVMGDDLATPYWGRYYLWEMIAYVGILPLLGAVFGAALARKRPRGVFTVLALLAILIALGKHTPLYPFLFRFLPGFNLLRGHCKFLLLASFFLAVLCSFGLDELLYAGKGRYRRLTRNLLAVAGAAAVIAGAVAAAGPGEDFWRESVLTRAAAQEREFNPPPDPDDEDVVRGTLRTARGAILTGAGLLLAAALLFYSRRAGMIRPRLAGALATAVILADLWLFGLPYVIPGSVERAAWPEEVVEYLKSDEEIFRVFTSGGLFANTGMLYGISNIAGQQQNRIQRYMDLINFSQGITDLDDRLPDLLEFYHLRYSPVFKLLNVKYTLLPPQIIPDPEYFIPRVKTDRMTVYLNREYLPRCYIVPEASVIPDRELILYSLLSPHFDARALVILEDKSAPRIRGGGVPGAGQARITSYSPHRVEIRAETDRAGYLVLADTFFPGWKAFVGEEEAEIYRANYVQRAVHLEPGRHQVEFVYRPASFRIGAAVAAAALAASAGLLLSGRGKKDGPRVDQAERG